MNYIVAASTDIGNVKETNQDAFSMRVVSTEQGKMVFAVLCDGMGGLSKGEVASSSVVNAFMKWADLRLPQMSSQSFSDVDIRTEWCEIVNEYNEKIMLYGKRSGISLGTTLTALLLTDSRYYIINVGDTRAYELTNHILILTRDQTVVARDVEMGLISSEAAETDPRRSVLLQCIGASEAVYPDMFFGDTVQGAVYMLCTDGFRHEISSEEIFQYLQPGNMTDESSMKANMDILININKQRQERDNITVLAIRTF